jgi:hypothetical protein
MSLLAEAIDRFVTNHPKFKALEERILALENRIGQDVKALAEPAGEAVINGVSKAIEDVYPPATTVTEELRAWGLVQWKKHCDFYEAVTPSDQFIIDLWNAEMSGKPVAKN